MSLPFLNIHRKEIRYLDIEICLYEIHETAIVSPNIKYGFDKTLGVEKWMKILHGCSQWE